MTDAQREILERLARQCAPWPEDVAAIHAALAEIEELRAVLALEQPYVVEAP